METKRLIAALKRVVGSSDELSEFEGLAGEYEYWYDEERKYIEDNAKDWDSDWDSLSEDDQDQKIQEWLSESEDDQDSSMIMFRNPKRLPKGTWVVHRTRADNTLNIVNDLDGCGPNNIGLTFHYGCSSGDLVFALGLAHTSPTDNTEYGTNGIVFKVDEAVQVDHISDNDSTQTVFDKNSITEAYPYLDDGKYLIFHDKDGNEIVSLKRGKDTFKKFVKMSNKEPETIPF